MPLSVTRLLFTAPPTVLTSTTTQYCDTLAATDPSGCTPMTGLPRGQAIPPETSLFIYPLIITDVTNQLLSSTSTAQGSFENSSVTTTTANFFDTSGNPTKINIQIQSSDGETYQKNTTNTFTLTGSDYQFHAITKLTDTTIKTQRTAPADGNNMPTTHTTHFTYGVASAFSSPFNDGAVTVNAMTQKRLEYGSGWPLEYTEAYGYDVFGNLITTVSCGNDYAACSSGSIGPADTGDPMHLPYRIKRTSFDPKDAPPSLVGGNVSLVAGLFPFKTTDALGHSTYSLYDPLAGKPRQTTDANGISTCYDYDSYGTQIDKVDHCGSAAPLKTTINRYFALGTGPAKVVTVTRPPNGAASWQYNDALGRSVQKVDRGFDGGLVATGELVRHPRSGEHAGHPRPPRRDAQPGNHLLRRVRSGEPDLAPAGPDRRDRKLHHGRHEHQLHPGPQ